MGIQAVHRLCSSWRIYAGLVEGQKDGPRISPLGLSQLRGYPPAGPHDPSHGRSLPDTPLVLACGDSSVRSAMFIAHGPQDSLQAPSGAAFLRTNTTPGHVQVFISMSLLRSLAAFDDRVAINM